jgi:hypothetical protein
MIVLWRAFVLYQNQFAFKCVLFFSAILSFGELPFISHAVAEIHLLNLLYLGCSVADAVVNVKQTLVRDSVRRTFGPFQRVKYDLKFKLTEK